MQSQGYLATIKCINTTVKCKKSLDTATVDNVKEVTERMHKLQKGDYTEINSKKNDKKGKYRFTKLMIFGCKNEFPYCNHCEKKVKKNNKNDQNAVNTKDLSLLNKANAF